MALPASIDALRVFQWGKESTHGTAVPATSKIAVALPGLDLAPTDLPYRPRVARGLIQRNPGFETVVARGTTWQMPDSPFTFEQAPNLLSMSVGSSGNTPVGAGPYVYTYTRNPAADPAPTSWTLERRLSDGTNFIDNKWAYALADKVTWKFAQDAAIMVSASGFARRIQAGPITAAQTLPAISLMPGNLLTAFIDSTWGTLGGTQATAQIYGGEISFGTGFEPFVTADGRTDLDFTTFILNPEKVTLDVKLLALVANAGVYATEKTAAEATTLRAVRIKGQVDANHIIQWDMLLKHKMGSVFKVGTVNGQDLIEMELEDSTDGTNLFVVTVTSQAATMT